MADSDWHWQTPVAKLLRELARDAEPRRLQAFACSCCRRVEHLLRDDRSRAGLAAAERFARGTALEDELLAARQAANFINGGKALEEYAMGEPHAVAAYACFLATKVTSIQDAAYVAHECALAIDAEDMNEEDEEWLEDGPPPPTPEEEQQCRLVRTMFGA